MVHTFCLGMASDIYRTEDGTVIAGEDYITVTYAKHQVTQVLKGRLLFMVMGRLKIVKLSRLLRAMED